MYMVDSGASLHMMEESSLSVHKIRTPYDAHKTTWISTPRMASSVQQKRRGFTSRSSVLTPSAVGGRFAFGVVTWTVVR